MKFLFALVVAVLGFSASSFATGYWNYEVKADKLGRNTCYAYTTMTNGAVLGLGINGQEQKLYTYIYKPTWSIPSDQEVNVDVAIDDSPTITTPGFVDGWNSHMIIIPVKQEYTRLFAHMVTAGHNMYIRFHGSEPDWNVSLWGSSNTYDRFFNCAKRIAPEWVWRNRPRLEATQPY